VNAKELAEKLRTDAKAMDNLRMSASASYLLDVAEAVEQLIPKYREPRPEDDGKYCYLEELPSDAPPTLVRCVPHNWVYWTVAGWRDLKLGKGIWPCERPE